MIEALDCKVILEIMDWTLGATLVAYLNQSFIR